MKIQAFRLGLFLYGLVALTQAQTEVTEEGPEEHAPSSHECDINKQGCFENEWCDLDSHPRRCWSRRPIGSNCNRDEKCLSNCCSAFNSCVDCGDPCAGVECSSGWHCANGACVSDNLCHSVSCPPGQSCDQGRCFWDDPCHGIECPADKTCENGECLWTGPCHNILCEEGKHCQNGVCIETDLCHDVMCSPGQFCEDGVCANQRPIGGKCSGAIADQKCLSGCCGDNFLCERCLDSCIGVNCDDGYYCYLGQCVSNCYGVACPQEHWCNDGLCYPPTCNRPIDCPPGYYCNNSNNCAVNECAINSNCAGDQVCELGRCITQACTLDVKVCPDGTVLNRIPPTCEFSQCPSIACQMDIFTCPDGTALSRLPPDCTFPPCPACPLDVKECPQGAYVGRDPSNGCNFYSCYSCAGIVCPDNQFCERGFCDFYDQCYGIQCAQDEFCEEGDCLLKRAIGSVCNAQDNCLTGCCNDAGRCEVCREPDPCESITCPQDEICNEGTCFNPFCFEDLDCPDGFVCDIIGQNRRLGGGQSLLRQLQGPPDEMPGEGGPPQEPGGGQEGGGPEESHQGTCRKQLEGGGLEMAPIAGCTIDGQCPDGQLCSRLSGECFYPFCFEDFDCPDGYNCKIIEHYATAESHQGTCCYSGCNNDDQCGRGRICQNGDCIADPSLCTRDTECPFNEYCEEGECLPYCYDNTYCATDHWCNNSHKCIPTKNNNVQCWANAQCTTGFCDKSSQPYLCSALLNEGQACRDGHDYQCKSDLCYDARCEAMVGNNGNCQEDRQCESGNCSCKNNKCAVLKQNGATCDLSCECMSSWCLNDRCQEKFDITEDCTRDIQCKSGACDTSCALSRVISCGSDTCVPTNGEVGDYCTANRQCKSNNCTRNQCGAVLVQTTKRVGGPFDFP